MNTVAIPLARVDAQRPSRKARAQAKGRQPTPDAQAQLRSLLHGEALADPSARSRLIEHLHRINDAHHGLRDRIVVSGVISATKQVGGGFSNTSG